MLRVDHSVFDLVSQQKMHVLVDLDGKPRMLSYGTTMEQEVRKEIALELPNYDRQNEGNHRLNIVQRRR